MNGLLSQPLILPPLEGTTPRLMLFGTLERTGGNAILCPPHRKEAKTCIR